LRAGKLAAEIPVIEALVARIQCDGGRRQNKKPFAMSQALAINMLAAAEK
jgi:hypothetical protein